MSRILQVTSSVTIPLPELHFRTSRSSGPGGQNVNKLETKVELLFDVDRSPSLSDEQKHSVHRSLEGRIDDDGILHVSSQRSRSQWENKELAIEKFAALLRSALKPRKKRLATGATRASKERRLHSKKKHGQKKKTRALRLDDE
jgi:ribosome-associated protein